MGKIAEALEGAGIDIGDVFGHTGDKYVVGEAAVDQAMKIEDADTRREVLGNVATQATRVTFGGSHEEAMSILSDIILGNK